jgi:DNA-binding NtrC family response regulator
MTMVELCTLAVKYHNIEYRLLSSGTILIVNDNVDIAELFAAALQTGGLKTVVTDEASVAVRKIKDNPDEYSLVLTDRSSQQDSDFPKQVKSINDQIKVLLAFGFALNDVEISHSRYDRILQLPITMSKLVLTVKELLNS